MRLVGVGEGGEKFRDSKVIELGAWGVVTE
jgi:hypothetical protein